MLVLLMAKLLRYFSKRQQRNLDQRFTMILPSSCKKMSGQMVRAHPPMIKSVLRKLYRKQFSACSFGERDVTWIFLLTICVLWEFAWSLYMGQAVWPCCGSGFQNHDCGPYDDETIMTSWVWGDGWQRRAQKAIVTSICDLLCREYVSQSEKMWKCLVKRVLH